VNVEILILPTGVVGDVQLLESSTHQVLDDAALATIRSLPRMPLPPDLPARPLRVRVPVVFQIQ
jgi:TonB family protein